MQMRLIDERTAANEPDPALVRLLARAAPSTPSPKRKGSAAAIWPACCGWDSSRRISSRRSCEANNRRI